MAVVYPIALVVAGLLAYANSFDGAFLLDDYPNIVDEPSVRTFDGVTRAPRRVVSLSLRVNYALGGYTVAGYHAFNLAVHLLAGLTLFGLLRRTFRRFPEAHSARAGATGLAFGVALLWLLHPLQTQAVTYIIQRTESLMALFYLLTLYCLVRGVDLTGAGRAILYIAAVLCCALGMMSKEVMVTAPLLALVYDRIFLAASWGELVRRRGLVYAGFAATWLLLADPWQWMFAPPSPITTAGFGLAVTPWEYLRTQAGVILYYLRLVFWPQPQCLDYGWPLAQTPAEYLAPGLVVLALLALTVWALWWRPWLGFWGAWFFVILAPTSSIMPISDVAFEHRMYLPLAGVLVLAVLAAHRLLLMQALRRGWSDSALRVRQAVTVMALAVVLGALTFMRNEHYRSELAMWDNVLSQYPRNARAHYNLGRALYAAALIHEANAAFRHAVELAPGDSRIRFGYAYMLYQERRYSEAAAQFAEVLRLNPDAHNARAYLDIIRAQP
jgi:hypothetical protein